MKKPTLILLLLGLPLCGCTTIGQQITNKNGTIAINQPYERNPPKRPAENKPIVNTKPPVRQTPTNAPQSAQKPTTHEYEYHSRRVVATYLVVQ
jgi:hypothetical protein